MRSRANASCCWKKVTACAVTRWTSCEMGDTIARAQFEASSLHTLVQMVAAGIGVTLVPRLAVDARIAEGTGISLSRLAVPASRRIGLAWRRTSLRAEELRLLADTLRELIDIA